MPVERLRAAFCTTGAPEPDLFNHRGEALCGVLKEAVTLLRQCSNAERDGYKRNRDHQPDLYEDIAVVGYGFLPRFFLWNTGSLKITFQLSIEFPALYYLNPCYGDDIQVLGGKR